MECLKHRISDPSFLRLIGRFLRAGIMEEGIACEVRVAEEPDVVVPQVRFREGQRSIPHGSIVWHPPYRKTRETENTKDA